jgi:hypothetical protein
VNNGILEISWQGLLTAFAPAAAVVGTALYATARMLVLQRRG